MVEEEADSKMMLSVISYIKFHFLTFISSVSTVIG